MNHHFFVRPCPSGARQGDHEHERTMRATIIVVIPLSAFLRFDATFPQDALVVRHEYKNELFWLRERLLHFSFRTPRCCATKA